MKLIDYVACLMLTGALAVGCATTPEPTPKPLAAAREEYRRATRSPAAKLAPSSLREAREALDLAEQAFDNDPDAQRSYDLAYVAHRKAMLAQAQALIERAGDQLERAESDAISLQSQLIIERQRQLEQARQRLEAGERSDVSERERLEETEKRLKEAEQQLSEAEKRIEEQQQRYEEVEQRVEATEQQLTAERQRAQAAEEALRRLGIMRETERGQVITLSGNLLFRSGGAELLESVEERLDQIASVLADMGDRPIIIEGFTDSVGSRELNQELSEDRARAVRDYLVKRGIDPNRIELEGRGESNPVASNATPEGRAMNRRVEIIIPRATPPREPGTAPSD